MPRPQFTFRALLVLVFAAAIWSFIAMEIRDAYVPGMGPADWSYVNRAKAAVARDQAERSQKGH